MSKKTRNRRFAGQNTMPLEERILTIRREKVIVDSDLAELYGVPTKALNQAVNRNCQRFPADFSFLLSPEEKCEVVTNCDHLKHLKFSSALPRVFTEHGAIMAATILNSPRAVQMSVFVDRAFVRMRAALIANTELSASLRLLERELKGRLNMHEAAIVDVLQHIMKLLDPPPSPPGPPSPEIGFHVREEATPYRIQKEPL